MPAFSLATDQGRFAALLLMTLATCCARGEDWLPISPQELSMRSAPKAPNAPAIYLYRQVDRDDNDSSESTYERIKILTEEGRDHANIEIPYLKGSESIRAIRARTIRPDGSMVNFDGEIFDKILVKANGIKYSAKTFTLPNVEVGSIIEYRYRHDFPPNLIYDSQWILSQDLFTQNAQFSLRAYPGFVLRFSWPNGIPPGSMPPKIVSDKVRMEAHDLPAFVTEEFMPPEDEVKYRVDFVYDSGDLAHEKDSASYWKAFSKASYKDVARFLDRPRALSEALAQIVGTADPDTVKLQKIYERTQRIRNLTFERSRSEEEIKREGLKPAKNVEDLLSHGYGHGDEITWLFLGLVRAAGFDAHPVLVPTRNKHFFNPDVMNARNLNDNVVLVMVGGQAKYFDPGARYTPYGMLPWYETAVRARRLDKDGGEWVTTTVPSSKENHIERKGQFTLSPSGVLEGHVTVTFTGQEAMSRRLVENLEDDGDRKQYLENDLKSSMPKSAEVQLTNRPDWDSSASSLEAQYSVRIDGWGTAAGSRLLLPAQIFTARQKSMFLHSAREHPVYFSYPAEMSDDITIEEPKEWHVSSLPQARQVWEKGYGYRTSFEDSGGKIHLQRAFRLDLTLVEVKYYGALQSFIQSVRSSDDEAAVLSRLQNTAAR
jgi:hypothetical protein